MSYGVILVDFPLTIIKQKTNKIKEKIRIKINCMSSQRKSKLLSLFLLLITWPVLGQDSTYVLTRDAFLSIVKKNHPTIKAANIQVRRAGSELLAARGGFDPSVTVDYEQKEFGKAYLLQHMGWGDDDAARGGDESASGASGAGSWWCVVQ